ncbi:unnamed protein product, partial [Rotaria sp. Silwood1]
LLLTITILGRRHYVFCDEAQKLLDNYIEELTKQACEADSCRITSFLAKQPIQIIRISALTQIIDLLPTIIQHVNIEHTIDDTFGLNTRLYNEIDQIVRQRFESQIIITTTSTSRAIYFHGYLLEQTLKLFDISPLEPTRLKMNMMGINNLQTVVCRQILMLPKIIITKENLFSVNELKKIDRNIGTKAFERLVTDELLIHDYFIITNTGRPIRCFAKVLPANENDREIISKKLRIYNIQLSNYIELSHSISIQPPSKLSMTGIQLFQKIPYSTIYEISTKTTELLFSMSSLRTVSSNNSVLNTLNTTNQPTTTNFNRGPSVLAYSGLQRMSNSKRNIVIRRSENNSNSQVSDIADDADIIVDDEISSQDISVMNEQ